MSRTRIPVERKPIVSLKRQSRWTYNEPFPVAWRESDTWVLSEGRLGRPGLNTAEARTAEPVATAKGKAVRRRTPIAAARSQDNAGDPAENVHPRRAGRLRGRERPRP